MSDRYAAEARKTAEYLLSNADFSEVYDDDELFDQYTEDELRDIHTALTHDLHVLTRREYLRVVQSGVLKNGV